jgi:nitrate reductase gamma subunit
VFLFYRLLRTNDVLWAGELLFHASLVLVLLRHLRLVLDPVPGWVWAIQPWGLIAGYLLPFTLIYILVIRLLTEQVKYSSPGNLFLLISLFVISLTGVMMHAWWKPDIIGIKLFMHGIFSLRPVDWPGGWLSTIHLIAVLVIIPYLPTHIFIAPAVMLEAQSREEGLHEVLHDR